MFKIVADEIWFMGEVFAKITMPLSVLRDQAEERLDLSNFDLDEFDTIEEYVENREADARAKALEDAVAFIRKEDEEFADSIEEELLAL